MTFGPCWGPRNVDNEKSCPKCEALKASLEKLLVLVNAHGIGQYESGTECTPWMECEECGWMEGSHNDDCPIGNAIKEAQELLKGFKAA